MRALILSLALLATPAPAADASLYALQAAMTSQDGKPVAFDAGRGHPTLISMFYAGCTYVCPTLIAHTQQLEKQLPPAARAQLRVLMISLDPEHDTPAALTELAQKHHADLARWTFARAEARDVRKIAALLGVQYRQLPDGSFNHSVLLTLVDADGKVVARSAKLTGKDPEFARALRELAGKP